MHPRQLGPSTIDDRGITIMVNFCALIHLPNSYLDQTQGTSDSTSGDTWNLMLTESLPLFLAFMYWNGMTSNLSDFRAVNMVHRLSSITIRPLLQNELEVHIIRISTGVRPNWGFEVRISGPWPWLWEGNSHKFLSLPVLDVRIKYLFGLNPLWSLVSTNGG